MYNIHIYLNIRRVVVLLFALANCFPLLIQQNVQASDFFNRSWDEFKVGFNDSSGNVWIGNDLLHELTKDNRYKLRFDLQQSATEQWFWAEYSRFIVNSEANGYRLNIAGYTGNAGKDAMAYSNGRKFTTYDVDNDYSDGKCAAHHGGGFWYTECTWCGVNGKIHFVWFGIPGSRYLKFSRMWLACH